MHTYNKANYINVMLRCGKKNLCYKKVLFALLYTNLTVNIRDKHRTKHLLNKGVYMNEKEDMYKFSEASKKTN